MRNRSGPGHTQTPRMSDLGCPNENAKSQPAHPRHGWLNRLSHFELREAWWAFLDAWETRRTLRWWIYGVGVFLVLTSILWFGVYPNWAQRNAIRMARQWIDAGQLGYAAETIQKALEADSRQPDLWRLAAEVARRGGQRSMEVQYLRQATLSQPGSYNLVLEWASAALQADMMDEAEQALGGMPQGELVHSSFAQRLLGELERRKNRLAQAKAHFEAALKIDGPGGVDELPLGLCLLATRDPSDRQRGLDLLTKLTADAEWGAGALRVLLTDAMMQNDRPAMAKWAEMLRTNPRCAVGDMPNCLSALAQADEGKFSEVIAQLKQAHLASPDAAAQLIGWLNQIGRSTEALEWMRTLPEPNLQRPPLVVSKAESLRCTGAWGDLRTWTAQGDWGNDLNFLRWAYGLQAARKLGDEKQAEELWRTLRSHAQVNGVHAYFAGSTIYAWGLVGEAETLWWQAAEQNNSIAIEALGTLARHYQVQRDAVGQYKVFNRLHALHPKDDAVANNFAFFAALTGNREQLAEQVARENFDRYPTNSNYRATYAFVLLMHNKAAEALKLMMPLAAQVEKSASTAFAYGLALAGTGEKTKAREVLHRLDPAMLTLQEVELIKKALGD